MKSLSLVCCLLACTLVACKEDKIKKEQLNGHWLLSAGRYNNQPAPFLDRIYFKFNDNQLTTNFNPASTEETVAFKISDTKIVKETADKMTFNIDNLTDSTLELSAELRGADFKLILKKQP